MKRNLLLAVLLLDGVGAAAILQKAPGCFPGDQNKLGSQKVRQQACRNLPGTKKVRQQASRNPLGRKKVRQQASQNLPETKKVRQQASRSSPAGQKYASKFLSTLDSPHEPASSLCSRFGK
jgi:hypothetical protein